MAENMEELLKNFWRKKGNASIIAAKHTEFVVEPKVFIGDQLNPEILRMLIVNYLAQTARQDSGMGGNIEASPDKLVIKSAQGKTLAIVRDRKLIQQYLASKTPY